ncbi:patatin-like phospholipase family protein [Pseudomaricurvus sp. HS19]|uniref:patatin-like phospholipase family protein n=1 Tax=Pseudomaricurvus sp. HS19 TaxID=2692626 RepID=UPI00136C8CBA|nr:patatin-like phospholipase family protein [Pseudomaricurvus sp. HS19]MYM64957.1 BamA/TamA family outer membrane protein [Pseudomaricurvus sp. HS19]
MVCQAAAEPQPAYNLCPPNLERPCVALVLGGGGARGSAHIGVIRALEEHGVPVDMVVGTSMGAFVGGLYASGKSPQELQELFEAADWNAGYRDDLSRSRIPNRRKRQLDDFPIHLDLGFSDGQIKLPKGVLQGQGMKGLLDDMLGYYPEFDSFDRLPIPFRAVAADAESGEEVVLSHGDLATAIQTSMSIPGVVRPIEEEGRVLVDGGVANNLPVSVARSLGAEVVIAVNIGSPGMNKDELQSGLAIMRQLVGLLTRQNVEYQKSLLTERDVLVEPELEGITTFSFEKSPQGIEAGYQAMQAQFAADPALQALAQPDYAAEHSQTAEVRDLYIDRVELDNQTRLADEYLLRRMGLESQGSYSLDEIQKGSERLYGQGTIARINTSVRSTDEEEVLDVYVGEKDWGPGYVDFKMSFEDDFHSFSRYQLGASYRLTNLSPYGAEWYSTAEFGTDKVFTSELYWPMGNTDFYWDAALSLERRVSSYREEGKSFGDFTVTQHAVVGGVGWNLADSVDLLAGVTYGEGTLELPGLYTLFDPDLDELDYDQRGGVLRFNFDTLDHATFPRDGWKLNAQLARTRDTLDGEQDYTTALDSELNGVGSWRRHSVRTQLRYQSTINDDPLSLLGSFSLGGFLNLSGLEKNSVVGQHVRFVSLVYTYEMVENDFGAITLPLYLGFSAEAGNAWANKDDVDYGDLIVSNSLFVGWDSPLGPAYLAYGHSNEGDNSFYIFLGHVF